MPGQVIHDSILGDNKEKTKVYWESRMRNEQLEKEKDKLNGFNKLRSTSNTSAVIHKINEEIEELHRREKELKQSNHGTKNNNVVHSPGSNHSNEDEDDVFSSNGSSVDEFEPAESPRLESGFYSNLGEDEQVTISPDLKGSESETESQNGDAVAAEKNKANKKHIVEVIVETKPEKFVSEEVLSPRPDSITPKPSIIDDDEPQTPTVFTFQKETPIEKEIRLSREREEEHRLRRQSSSVSPAASPAPVSAKPAVVSKPTTVVAQATVKPSAIKENEKRRELSTGIKEPKRNIQYQLATERLRKEILEAKRREDELKSRGRIHSSPPVVETMTPLEEPSAVETYSPEIPKLDKIEELHVHIPEAEEPKPVQVTPKIEAKEHKAIERRASVSTETLSKEPSFYKSTSNLLGRPTFNTYQRYLIKTSTQLRIAKNFQLPAPTPDPKEEIKATPQDPIPDSENDEPVTPRRKLVKATDKIEKELREMKERERELALIRTRSFKSTPNLFESIDKDENDNDTLGADEESEKPEEVVAEKFERKPFVERKRSALINQWQEKINSNNNSSGN